MVPATSAAGRPVHEHRPSLPWPYFGQGSFPASGGPCSNDPSTKGFTVNLDSGERWHQYLVRSLTDEAAGETQRARGLLSHHLTDTTQAIVIAVLVAAALLGFGNALLLFILAGYVAALIVFDQFAARPTNPVSPMFGFRLATLGWPLAFILLGAASWSNGSYYGEPVAVVAMLVAGMVALILTTEMTVFWAMASMGGIAIGAKFGGGLSFETLEAIGGVAAGALFGNRLQHVIEQFLGTRRVLMHEVTRVPSSSDPFAMAAALLEPLGRHTPLKTASITWFTDDGRSVLLGMIGKNLPSFFRPGAVLPEHRNEYFRNHASSGPWITGWTIDPDDEGYSKTVAAMGVDAVAYMPLSFEGRTIGLLGAAIANPAGGRAMVAEHIPILAEVADVVATTMGPSIAVMEEHSSATRVIDDILAQQRYWPVFQPVRDLTSNRIVGFEALTRFDAPQTTQRLFDHASLVGRGRDLEIATLRAAVKASGNLPSTGWVSVNSSAAMLSETDTFAAILEPLERPTVIELSEHDLITDYAPIAAAMERLGASRTLAVDDAGSGFASLRHILEVRPAYVKLDIGLVQGAASDLSRRALVAGFVHFARDANFTLIAEGIESVEDLNILKKLGVALGQGYLLGRPERAGFFDGQPAVVASPRRRAQRARSS
jgi:EAL domain-containing protein (putative c-di-GMP-specific phosphodiesterase class I)